MSGFGFQFSDFGFMNHVADFELRIWLHLTPGIRSAHCSLLTFLVRSKYTNKAANATPPSTSRSVRCR